MTGDLISKCEKMAAEGLHKDVFDLLEPRILDPGSADLEDKELVANAVGLAVAALQRLNRISEVDALLEKTVEVQGRNWRTLEKVATIYSGGLPAHGSLVDNVFYRGNHDGQWINTGERDRVRALRLFVRALPSVLQDEDKKRAAEFFRRFAETLQAGRAGDQAWKLQSLTDLDTLPDYNAGGRRYRGTISRAPVDAEGRPVLYGLPESFEAAENDGQRWRWVLDRIAENDPSRKAEVFRLRAEFSRSQFGEQTLAEYPFFREAPTDPAERSASIWNLETLGDDEVIAKLATGIKRFQLDEENHYILLYRRMFDVGDTWQKIQALERLAGVYLDRRQYTRSADIYRDLIENYSKPQQGSVKNWQKQLDRITGSWGRFEPTESKVVGMKTSLRYVFRNGNKVKLSAREIRIPTLIEDIRTYLRSKPVKPDWRKLQIEQIGWQLIFGPGNKPDPKLREKYLGDEVAAWSVDLKPAEKHFDGVTNLSVPIEKGGAYLVKAEMEGGNVEYVVLWLNDTAIVSKQWDGGNLYFVADAATGEPVASAELDFFGYKVEWKTTARPGNRQRQESVPEWTIDRFTRKTDADGLAFLEIDEKQNDSNWLVTARDSERRFAHLGFNNVWFSRSHESRYDTTRAFFISDRPVYRPGDRVEMKLWVGSAGYSRDEQKAAFDWAGKTVSFDVYDPRGEKVLETKNAKLDDFGGLTFALELPKDATLGEYQFVPDREESIRLDGYGSFRVEEYRKPEYEVTVEAPKDPVRLGETVRATIRAHYYFGSPVTEATVKYKVTREKVDERWFPVRPWDWFYGNGYGWLGGNSYWLPGWSRWGVARPLPHWFPLYSGPPEIVSEREVPIGEDGTVEVEIDTAPAQAMFPGDDQRYTITAEVVDRSRRTILGNGEVLVSREPLKVYVWTDRGWYEPNRKIEAFFQARRLDGKPVPGDADVKLYKISCRRNEETGTVAPVETEVHAAGIRLDEEGKARLSLDAALPGQYRISCTLDGREGGYVFNVFRKDGSNESLSEAGSETPSWVFGDLELLPDRAEYRPGENVALRVNADRKNAFVLLFVRAENDRIPKPQVLRLDGKTSEVSIPVRSGDMPNFFVEALTVSRGMIVNEVREIIVPPESKVLNVEIRPSRENYKPGEKAAADLVLTDGDGNPVSGQTVVSIYDKSVEYISGGSNVEDIREFFWKWRRDHQPRSESNLRRVFGNMPEPGKPGMTPLGIFGNVAVALPTESDQYVIQEMTDTAIDFTATESPMLGGMVLRNRAAIAPSAMVMSDAAPEAEAGGAAHFKMLSKDEAVNGSAGMVEPAIRENFADTALWVGALRTDENGKARIELEMPDSLTTWKIKVWSISDGTRVGQGEAEIITRKDLILRMQTPRFLVEKDRVVFSANIHNYLSDEKQVKVSLETNELLGSAEGSSPEERTVAVPAGGEARIDWQVVAKSAGEASVTMKALTDEDSDAMRKTLTVYVHGMLKQEAFSGYIAPDKESGIVEIEVPEQRKPEHTRLTVRFSPTLAASMIEALPYLVDYPYGCTEQTLNRFLPTVIVRKILQEGNIDLEKIREARTNLNAQELGEGRKPALSRRVEPVFDAEQLHEMVADGVRKLTDMQCSDGGWGWFGGYGEHSSAHLTALVVHGLRLAHFNGARVDAEIVARGEAWLRRYQAEQVRRLQNGLLSKEERGDKDFKTRADEIDAFVMMVLSSRSIVERTGGMSEEMTAMREFLWRDRGELSPYGTSMLGIGLHAWQGDGDKDKIETCVKMLEQYLVQDEENQTARLNLAGHGRWFWWCWHGSEFETQAYYLKLLMRTDPKSPVAPRLVKYLLNNRRHATYWNSTRDTAVCIEAFAEFLRTTGEDKPEMTVEVLVDGQVKKSVSITPENLFGFDNTLVLRADEVSTGAHRVELRKKGRGPLYFNAYLENFTLEDPIEKTGLEVKIERRFYRLDRDESATNPTPGGRGQALDLKVEKYKRTPVDSFFSGDLVEVELIVESKNDYESIVIEDRKAAGLEPVDLRSGYTGAGLGAYVEYRDERVALFVYRLPRGKHSLTYRLRAEQPGSFSALPARIEGMYAPELKGNSDENKIGIADR